MAEQVYWEDVNEGDEIPRLVKNCSTQQLMFWAAGSGDFNPLHYDTHHALSQGTKDIIVHGALKNAFIGQLLDDWVGEEGRVKSFGCSYRGMDYTYQDIICRGVVTKKSHEGDDHIVELDVWTETGPAQENGRPKNPEGIKTSPGSAKVMLPTRGHGH